jgi:deoxyribose-phosphate aldolase
MDLATLAQDALRRLKGTPLPARIPQLLAWSGDRVLLRGPEGLREAEEGDLPSALDLGPIIDHTLLRPGARAADIEGLCGEARERGLASVCVNPLWVPLAARCLRGTPVGVCTVAGFPLGADSTRTKATEAGTAREEGAAEIDMVLAIGPALDGNWRWVAGDYRAVRQACPGAVLKVILETCLLPDDVKREACRIAREEGLDFVKTSTGFAGGGATEADVALMRETVGVGMGVKASGGIRTGAQALAMVKAGATRLGLSASLAILEETGAGR